MQPGLWGYFFGFLSIVFAVLALLSFMKPGQKGSYVRTRIRTIIWGFVYLFLLMSSLSLFGYTQKPEGIQTIIFCFMGQLVILLVILGIAILQIHLSDRQRIDEKELFPSIFKRKK